MYSNNSVIRDACAALSRAAMRFLRDASALPACELALADLASALAIPDEPARFVGPAPALADARTQAVYSMLGFASAPDADSCRTARAGIAGYCLALIHAHDRMPARALSMTAPLPERNTVWHGRAPADSLHWQTHVSMGTDPLKYAEAVERRNNCNNQVIRDKKRLLKSKKMTPKLANKLRERILLNDERSECISEQLHAVTCERITRASRA